MRVLLSLSVLVVLVGGCSQTGDPETSRSGTPELPTGISESGETDAEPGRLAAPPTSAASERAILTRSMPEAVRGQWRENDLARAPLTEDCNQTSQSNKNFGKVLSINADGYTLFEDGGQIIDVHSRTDTMIDATFDTTYADTPTRARRNFTLQPSGSLVVHDDEEDWRHQVTEYVRCP